MPALSTVAIVSWKDPTQKWIINEADFDPAKHTLWENRQADPPVEEFTLNRGRSSKLAKE